MLKTNNISKKYPGCTNDTLHEITNEFPNRGMVAIVGKSGSGKTTLLNILSGLDMPTGGEISIDGEVLNNLPESEITRIRNEKIGIVFQENNLIRNLSVEENLRLVLDIQDWKDKNYEEVNQRIKETLAFVDLSGYEKKKVNKMSGGEIQRVAVARAIIRHPQIIFADEPTGSLDKKNSEAVFKLLSKASEQCLVVVVTHDRESAFIYADECLEIEDGCIKNRYATDSEKKIHYDLTLKNGTECEKTEANLSGEALLQLITNCIMQLPEGSSEIGLKIQKKKDDFRNNVADEGETRNKPVQTHLPFKSIISFAVANMEKNKLRLFLTGTMLLIVLTLVIIVSFLCFNSAYPVIGKYVKQNNINRLYVKNVEKYTVDKDVLLERDIYGGKPLSDALEREEQIQAYKYKRDVEMVFGNAKLREHINVLAANFKSLQSDLINGRLPSAENEIAVTDFIMEKLETAGNELGDEVFLDGVKVVITGVVATDYKDVVSKVLRGEISEDEAIYKEIYEYGKVYFTDAFPRYVSENKDSFNAACLQAFTKTVQSFLKGKIEIAGSGCYSEDDLYFGRLPASRGEVCISKDFADNYGYSDDQIQRLIGQKIKLWDIYDDSLGRIGADAINYYDYFPDGLTIVGVISSSFSETGKFLANLIFYEDIYREIKTEYYKYYYLDALEIAVNPNHTKRVMQFSEKEGVLFDEPGIKMISSFYEEIRSYRVWLISVLIVFIVLAVLMINSYAEKSISGNKREIGILRALGLPLTDGIWLYVIEGLMVFFSAGLVSLPIVFLILKIFNKKFFEILTKGSSNLIGYLELIQVNYPAILIIGLVGGVIMLLAIAGPIIRFTKKKPIELIRD